MILEAILLGSHQVSTFILGDFDLPLPGGGSGQSVDINVDLIAQNGGGDEHVLASVVAADGGWGGARLSTVQSPTVMLSAAAGVEDTPEGAVSTIVSKSILSLQTSVLVGQKV